MTTELNPELNEVLRWLRGKFREGISIIIASIALVVALLSLLQSHGASDSSKTAEIRSEMQTEKIQEMELKIQTQDAKLYNLHKTINEKEP